MVSVDYERDMLRRLIIFFFLMTAGVVGEPVFGQAAGPPAQRDTTLILIRGHGRGFVDADGDGYNDNAPDHDGDGIPNGLDPDFQRFRRMRGRVLVDADSNGFDDRLPDFDSDGIPNRFDPDFVGPRTRNGGRGYVGVDGRRPMWGRGMGPGGRRGAGARQGPRANGRN